MISMIDYFYGVTPTTLIHRMDWRDFHTGTPDWAPATPQSPSGGTQSWWRHCSVWLCTCWSCSRCICGDSKATAGKREERRKKRVGHFDRKTFQTDSSQRVTLHKSVQWSVQLIGAGSRARRATPARCAAGSESPPRIWRLWLDLRRRSGARRHRGHVRPPVMLALSFRRQWACVTLRYEDMSLQGHSCPSRQNLTVPGSRDACRRGCVTFVYFRVEPVTSVRERERLFFAPLVFRDCCCYWRFTATRWWWLSSRDARETKLNFVMLTSNNLYYRYRSRKNKEKLKQSDWSVMRD